MTPLGDTHVGGSAAPDCSLVHDGSVALAFACGPALCLGDHTGLLAGPALPSVLSTGIS